VSIFSPNKNGVIGTIMGVTPKKYIWSIFRISTFYWTKRTN